MKDIRNILGAWSELWRYPELLVPVSRGSTGQEDSSEDDTMALVKGLIDGIAAPKHPKESVMRLISVGEFAAAERVLGSEGFAAEVDEGDREKLSQALDEARDRAAEEVRARAAVLEARARRVGLTAAMPGGIDDAVVTRQADADLLLDKWEDDIRAAEAKLTDTYRQRLAKTTEKPEEEVTPQKRAWQASVQRCLDAGEYDTARVLLDAGPTVATPIEPFLVPRRPPWPFDEPLEEVLEWFKGTRPAPPDFHDRWRHDPADQQAERLVEALSRLSGGAILNVESVRGFATCLDRFLGQDEAEPKVYERGDWFETRLRAVVDPRLPCLAGCGPDGARLWIPRTREARPPELLPQDAMGICFLPFEGVTNPARTISFDTSTLLSLLGDRDQEHRRINFLRVLGNSVELDVAIPPELGTLPLPPQKSAAARVFVAWVLDIVNVEIEEPAVIDLIVHYSGADPRLALHLLRALFRAASSRRSALGPGDINHAFRSPTFRDAARLELLGPLDAHPPLRAVLGAALLMGDRPGGTVSVEDVCFALQEILGNQFEEAEVRTSLDRLVELGMLDVLEAGIRYRIPLSGVGSVLLDAIDDPESYVREALDALGRS